MELREIGVALRPSSRLARVKANVRPFHAADIREKLGDVSDRDRRAATDVDRPGEVIAHKKTGDVREVRAVQEVATSGTIAPDVHGVLRRNGRPPKLVDQGRQNVAGLLVEVVARSIEI